MKTIADLVNELFRTHRHPQTQREYMNTEVSRALEGQIDQSYLAKLRKGKVDNPTRNTLLLLCQFFDVPSSYFFPELDIRVPPEQTSLRVALRATSLDEETQEKLLELIQTMAKQLSTAKQEQQDDSSTPS